MDDMNTDPRKVLAEEPSTPTTFTFVPVLWALPSQSISTEEALPGALTGNSDQIQERHSYLVKREERQMERKTSFAVSHEETTEETMSDGRIFKAEKVFIGDCEEGGAGHKIQLGTKCQLNLSQDHMSLQSPSVSAQSENTTHHEAPGTAAMKPAVYKHRGVSEWQCRDNSGLSEVSSGGFLNRVSEDRTSPTNSADLFPTPASSRESILSEGSDRDKSWSAVQLSSAVSPSSFSRTVSPCSSVLSGIFSPAVVQIKRHFLAPGSSLLQTPFSSCESLSSSVCLQSPPPVPRHRPPLTRLSLLTAILRKGRLPVLSSTLQRPYTPCWPVNPVTLSFCNACSAASSVASIPLEFSSRFSSSASIDSQSHRELNRCVTSPPPELRISNSQTQTKTCTEKNHRHVGAKSVPTWEQVISPTAEKNSTRPRAPLTALCSNYNSVPPGSEDIDSAANRKLQHTHLSISPEPKQGNNSMYHPGNKNNNLKKLISLSPKLIRIQESAVPQKWTPSPQSSSLSRLHSLSQQLKSPPVSLSPPPLQPSRSHSLGTNTSITSPLHPARMCEPDRSCSNSQSAKSNTSHCLLSPSRYTPIIFTGWPSPTCSRTPTPSPAPPVKSLSPSPPLSLRSTPSPRPGSEISDCSDRDGKKRKTHKIKLSYKSLAAIPTNTLLLDQQTIDEQVERGESPYDTLDGGVTDTHSEMRSPSQLRQQSEELYAVIDEILADSIPPSKTSQSPQPSRSTSSNTGQQQNNSSFLKSLGRETKYASLSSLHQSTGVDRKLMDTKKTKPGVIRPMTAIPRLRVEDEEEFRPNPFRLYDFKEKTSDNRKVENKSLLKPGQDFYRETTSERRTPFSVCDLQITEPDDRISHQLKDVPTSFSTTEGRMNTFETHI